MKCDSCEEEHEILLPIKIETSKEVKDSKLCYICFESLLEGYSEGKFPDIHSLTFPQYQEGKCRACGRKTKYLREITLSLREHHREVALCPYCIKNLREMHEKGELRAYDPVFIWGF